MASQQLRKPLSEVERTTKKTVVCVTGAAGYLASSLVSRLLAAGHSVRGTVRDPSNAAKNAHLWALPGAKQKLKLFKVRERNEHERESERGGWMAFSISMSLCSTHGAPSSSPFSLPFLSPFLSLPLSRQPKADITDPSSFDEALQGCTALIHTASPVIMNPAKGRERELLIEPAVQGAGNVLRAATRARTVT